MAERGEEGGRGSGFVHSLHRFKKIVLKKKIVRLPIFLKGLKQHNRFIALKEWFYRKKIARSPIF